jgi:hypothetical protein
MHWGGRIYSWFRPGPGMRFLVWTLRDPDSFKFISATLLPTIESDTDENIARMKPIEPMKPMEPMRPMH